MVVDEPSVAQAQGAVAFVEVVVAAGAERDEVEQSGEVAEPPGHDVVRHGAAVVAAVDGAGRSPSGSQGSSFGAVGHPSGAAGADGGAEGVEQDGVELTVAAEALQGLWPQGGGASVGEGELGGQGAEAAFDGGEGGDDGQVRRWWLADGAGGGGVVEQVAQRVVSGTSGGGEAERCVGAAIRTAEVAVGSGGPSGSAGVRVGEGPVPTRQRIVLGEVVRVD